MMQQARMLHVHVIVNELPESEKASGLGFYLMQHDNVTSKDAIPAFRQPMPGAKQVKGGLNPHSAMFLESCFCKHPTTNFCVDLSDASLVKSPAKQQITSPAPLNDSDDSLMLSPPE